MKIGHTAQWMLDGCVLERGVTSSLHCVWDAYDRMYTDIHMYMYMYMYVEKCISSLPSLVLELMSGKLTISFYIIIVKFEIVQKEPCLV